MLYDLTGSLMCRFLPDGTFLYRTSPEVLVKVERSLRAPFVRSRADEGVQKGRYLLLVSFSCVCMCWLQLYLPDILLQA